MVQNIISRPWERAEGPWLCLMTTQLLFSLLWPFSFVSTFINSLTKLILWSFPQRAGKGHGTGARNKGFCSFHHSSAENWVKDLLSIALPTREILSPQSVPPTRKLAQASYPCPSEGNTEEARISILWPPEWKLQSQKTKQCGHMDHNLVYLMKLSVMPCRAIQDGQVMMERSDDGEGMVSQFNIPALRTPWTVWKGKSISYWRMRPLGW